MSKIKAETVTYRAGDTTLQGYLAVDEEKQGKRPAVLVVHEWWGLNDYIRGRARMLAELGYTALAVDMYGDGKVGGDPGEAGALMTAALSDRAALEARFKAAVDFVSAQPSVDGSRVGAMGYCFGGAVVLHAARIGLPLRGVVSFHGSLGSFQKPAPGAVKAKILVCHGGADSLVPDEQIAGFKAEMDDAKADYQFVTYDGALHGYTNPEATEKGKAYGMPLAYEKSADEKSWVDMKAFWTKVFA